jgi:hypothetical protein
MTIITIEYLPFEQCSAEVQSKAIELHRDINTNHEWYDCTIEDAKEALALVGFDIDNVFFSGFSMQGGGACFTGGYAYKKGALAAVKGYAPNWLELHELAETLQRLQKGLFYCVSTKISHSGNYSHSGCTSFDFELSRGNSECWLTYEQERPFIEAMRSFMDCIYKTLEKEYNYLTSEAQIKEALISNGYEFNNSGEIL